MVFMKKISYCNKDIGLNELDPESVYATLDDIYSMMDDIGVKRWEYPGTEAEKSMQIWEIPDRGCIIMEEECNGFSFELSFNLIGFDENSPEYRDILSRIRSFERGYR